MLKECKTRCLGHLRHGDCFYFCGQKYKVGYLWSKSNTEICCRNIETGESAWFDLYTKVETKNGQ